MALLHVIIVVGIIAVVIVIAAATAAEAKKKAKRLTSLASVTLAPATFPLVDAGALSVTIDGKLGAGLPAYGQKVRVQVLPGQDGVHSSTVNGKLVDMLTFSGTSASLTVTLAGTRGGSDALEVYTWDPEDNVKTILATVPYETSN